MAINQDVTYAIRPSALPRVLKKSDGTPAHSASRINFLREEGYIGYVKKGYAFLYPIDEVEKVFKVRVPISELSSQEILDITGMEVVSSTRDLAWLSRHNKYVTKEGLIGALEESGDSDGIEDILEQLEAGNLYMVGKIRSGEDEKLYFVKELEERGVPVDSLPAEAYPLNGTYSIIFRPSRKVKEETPRVYLLPYIQEIVARYGLRIDPTEIYLAALETCEIVDKMVPSDTLGPWFSKETTYTNAAKVVLSDLISSMTGRDIDLVARDNKGLVKKKNTVKKKPAKRKEHN